MQDFRYLQIRRAFERKIKRWMTDLWNLGHDADTQTSRLRTTPSRNSISSQSGTPWKTQVAFVIFISGFIQSIWSTFRVDAGLSIFADTRSELIARSSTGRQGFGIPTMMLTRKPPDCVQCQVETRYLHKGTYHEIYKRYLWFSWQDSRKASDQPFGLMQDFRYLQIGGVNWAQGQALDDRVVKPQWWSTRKPADCEQAWSWNSISAQRNAPWKT